MKKENGKACRMRTKVDPGHESVGVEARIAKPGNVTEGQDI